jgi:uncharacterized protein YndB with AHSA1/START domain
MNRQVTMERTLDATVDDVWELWTTKEGIESWWGPDGFRVTCNRLELQVGGALEYVMTAVGEEQIAFMLQANQPLSQTLKARYSVVEPKRLVAWQNLVDFVPKIEPYEVETRVQLFAEGARVRMVLSFDVMHDDFYTGLAEQGWSSELGKLAAVIERRRRTPA